MKKVSARDFKARCVALVNEVQKTKEPVAITKGGKLWPNWFHARSRPESSWDNWKES
jgi:hypothetical protein